MANKKKVRLKASSIIFMAILLLAIIFLLLFETKITNIYITGNTILSDYEIMELANINEYPKTFMHSSNNIKNKLKQNKYIKEAVVTKKNLKEVYINITENKPLFYDAKKELIVLSDETTTTDEFVVPTLNNNDLTITDIPNEVYTGLIKALDALDYDVLKHISEIKYTPNTVDNNRFFLNMIDGNYVYINIERFSNLDKYLVLSTTIGNKKGIFYLDYGNKFEAF